MIEFRSLNNLQDVILSHSVSPHQPGVLCTVSPCTLLYVDHSKTASEIHWLDLKDLKPKFGRWAADVPRINNCSAGTDTPICYVPDGGTHLLVFVCDHGIFAYNKAKENLEWEIEKILQGNEKPMDAVDVASDGRGNLFVCDRANECIQMFSVSDGQYLGCLIKKGEQGLGYPWRLKWCENKSSLIVAQIAGSEWSICTIYVQY